MSVCQLCGASENISSYKVEPKEDTIEVCQSCLEAMKDPAANERHWNCLHDSMWSEDAGVQVMAYRLLTALGAQDQLDMLYLDEETLAWAQALDSDEEAVEVRDSNGNILVEGDSVTIIKDLPVKGAGFTAKQGTTVKNIKMAPGDPTHIQGRVNGSMIFLKTEFLKKL